MTERLQLSDWNISTRGWRSRRVWPHGAQGNYLRDWIHGGIDGTITTFAIVAGVVVWTRWCSKAIYRRRGAGMVFRFKVFPDPEVRASAVPRGWSK
jgi:hypothetical protein